MLAAALVSATLAIPALPVSEEKDLFRLPQVEDVRMQRIARVPNETGWPFSVDAGLLMCLYVVGMRTVYFAREDEPERIVIVSADPLDIAFGNMGNHDLLVPGKDLAELITLLAPFARLGGALCDQPRGTSVGEGEL